MSGKVLVSACLLGERVRYDARDAAVHDDHLDRWLKEGLVVPICPEMAGGAADVALATLASGVPGAGAAAAGALSVASAAGSGSEVQAEIIVAATMIGSGRMGSPDAGGRRRSCQ